MEQIMEGDALNPFALWATSIGLTPYEQSSISGGGSVNGTTSSHHQPPRDGSGRSYQSSRPRRNRRQRGNHNNNNTNHANHNNTNHQNHNGNNSHNGGGGEEDDDVDELVPSFYSARRTSTLYQATCQMAGSMLGAGILLLFLPAASQLPPQPGGGTNNDHGDHHDHADAASSSSSSSYYYFPGQVVVKHPALILLTAVLAERIGCLTLLAARYAGVNSLPDLLRVAYGRTVHRADAIVSTILSLTLLIIYQTLLLETGRSIMRELDVIVTTVSDAMYLDDAPVAEEEALLSQRQHLPLMLATFGCVLIISPIYFNRDFQYIQVHLFTTLATAFCLATSSSSSTTSYSNNASMILQQQPQHDGGDPQQSQQQHVSSSQPLVVLSWLILLFFSNQILKVQNVLIEPTRRRTSWTVSLSVTGLVVLLILLAHLSVLFSYNGGSGNAGPQQQQPDDNVDDDNHDTNNLDPDWWLHLARILYRMVAQLGCVPTLLLAYGVHLPHARRHLLHVIEFSCIDKGDPDQCKFAKTICPDECCDEDAVDEETCVSFPSISTWSTAKSHVDVIQVAPNEDTTLLLPRIEEGLEPCNVYTNAFAHYTSTAAILVVTFGLACLLYLTQVSAWSLWQWTAALSAGTYSLALPAACFVQIQSRQAFVPWRIPWLAFCYFSMAVAVVVTVGATGRLVMDCILTSRHAAAFRAMVDTAVDAAIWW
jgi:hypothetical protein